MPRTPILCAGVLTLAVSGYLFYARDRDMGRDMYTDMATWHPSPVMIQQEMGPLPTGTTASLPLDQQQARLTQFSKLFQQRYRSHTPPMAVGLQPGENGIMELKCPARLETWNMNRIALAAWNELHAAMGQRYGIDIFETYIGTPPIKVGELRPTPNDPHSARIVYFYQQQTRPHPKVQRLPQRARRNNSRQFPYFRSSYFGRRAYRPDFPGR